MKIRKIFDNIEIKLICLLLAVVMWFYVSKPTGTEGIDKLMAAISRGERGRIMFRDISVKIVGLKKEWKANPEKISIVVECLDAEIEPQGFQVLVRLAQEDEKDRRVILTADKVMLPRGLIFVRAEPNNIQLVPTRK